VTSSRHQGGAFAFCMVRDWQVLWRRVLTGAWAAITVPFGYGALRRCGSRVKVRSVQHAQPATGWPHSHPKATIGSTLVARRAGT